MHYEARALSANDTISRLRLEATDAAEARRQLQAQGWQVLSLRPTRSAWRLSAGVKNANLGATTGGSNYSTRGGKFSLLLFSQELLALLEAGLSLIEALEALVDKETSALNRAVLSSLLNRLREGQRFSAALGLQPSSFPSLYIGIVQAAEGTSALPKALRRYIAYRQRVDVLRAKVVSALVYPLILLSVGTAVSLFLMLYVVPRFAQIYSDSGRPLPGVSRWLFLGGNWIAAHPLLLGVLMAAGLGSLIYAVRSGALLRALGQLPGVGARLRLYMLSRLYLTLGLLTEGGIPMVPALRVSATGVPPGWRAALSRATAAVDSGAALSSALHQENLTTPISLRMLRVGEQSGQLAAMLGRAAGFHEEEIARFIDQYSRALEPLLMAAMGLVIGLIVVLLYLPIFDLAGSLQ